MARPPTVLTFESPMPASAWALYAWHAEPAAFERLTPPWLRVEVLERRGTIRDGDRTVLRIRVAPLLWRRWVAVHGNHVAGRCFTDVQEAGPFASFEHQHRFEPQPDGTSRLVDRVAYREPWGWFGRMLLGRRIRRDLERTFAHRHAVTRADLLARGGREEPH